MRAAGRLPSEDNHTKASKSEKDKSDRLTIDIYRASLINSIVVDVAAQITIADASRRIKVTSTLLHVAGTSASRRSSLRAVLFSTRRIFRNSHGFVNVENYRRRDG